MCKTYNIIGSLTTLKLSLEQNNIYDFKSLKEVIKFQESYSTVRQQLVCHHENLIEEEKKTLYVELTILNNEIQLQRQQTIEMLTNEINILKQQFQNLNIRTSTNFFQKRVAIIKHWNYKVKIKYKEYSFQTRVDISIARILEEYQIKNKRYQFITSCFNEAVRLSAHFSLTELDRKKEIIDKLNNFIYGALGEQKVVKTLESALSDEYFLINDFNVTFSKAIYNRQEKDYIKSVQIDHILVGPSGIFLIETKNWSEKSINSLNLRSPVEQIKRTSFALFYLLNNESGRNKLRLDKHHWGAKKISIKNLIVLINPKPKEEFQFVKVLTLSELVNYVNYFKPIYTFDETSKIAEKILELNGLSK